MECVDLCGRWAETVTSRLDSFLRREVHVRGWVYDGEYKEQ